MINCTYCKVDKPIGEFYSSSIHKNGTTGGCKLCLREKSILNRAKKLDYYRDFDRKRANNPERVKAREEYLATDRGQQKTSAAKVAYAERNPFIRQAHNMVNNAVRDGRLFKPSECESCNDETALHGHHCDYNKPMDVMWLCDPCHKQWHRDNEPVYCSELKAS